MKTGASDAFILTVVTIANIAASGDIRSVVSANKYLPKKYSLINSNIVTSRRDYLKANPETVGKAVKAIIEGVNFLSKNHSWVLAKLKSEWKYDRPVGEMMLARLKYNLDGKIDPDRLKNAVEFLLEYEVLKKKDAPRIKIDEIYTGRFTG